MIGMRSYHRPSQSNPLKAIAEFVENCIDAHAKTIAITRSPGEVLLRKYRLEIFRTRTPSARSAMNCFSKSRRNDFGSGGREHGEHYLTVKDDGDGVPAIRTGCPTSSTSRLISATRSSDA
jgi:hypothetical protein